MHASTAEDAVVGKKLLEMSTLTTVLQKLKTELRADHVKPDAGPEYRQGLACSLFYKVSTQHINLPNEVAIRDLTFIYVLVVCLFNK